LEGDVRLSYMLRALAPTPLSWAEDRWEKVDDVRSLHPDLDPRRLCVNGEELVYDLSCFFSRSDEVNLAEKGQNKDHIHLPQVNLTLLCSAEQGLPTMIRALPGSVRDVATILRQREGGRARGQGLDSGLGVLQRGRSTVPGALLPELRLACQEEQPPLWGGERGRGRVPLPRPPDTLQEGERRPTLALPLRGHTNAGGRGEEPDQDGEGWELEQGRELGRMDRVGHIIIVSGLDR
jgi:hypothetical protein